jgi:hypothetical protein
VRRIESIDAELIDLERRSAGFGPVGPLTERYQQEALEKLAYVRLQRDRIVADYEALVRRYESGRRGGVASVEDDR